MNSGTSIFLATSRRENPAVISLFGSKQREGIDANATRSWQRDFRGMELQCRLRKSRAAGGVWRDVLISLRFCWRKAMFRVFQRRLADTWERGLRAMWSDRATPRSK